MALHSKISDARKSKKPKKNNHPPVRINEQLFNLGLAILVEAPVSSMNTRRSGANSG